MSVSIKLLIAGVLVECRSEFPLEGYSAKQRYDRVEDRFTSFYYQGARRPDICIQVYPVHLLPRRLKTRPLVSVYHPDDGKENWRLEASKKGYVYVCPLRGKQQYITINKGLNRVKAFVQSKHRTRLTWDISDIIYDFLQVLFIAYFAKNKKGIIMHSAGICDTDGRGFLFAGESGAGKTTISRIWHLCGSARVINDDRVIIRRGKQGFLLHSSPWHGELGLERVSQVMSAPLSRIFFLHHNVRNSAPRLSEHETFCLLYPSLFAPFWDRLWLKHTVDFAEHLARAVDCRSLGFVNNERVVPFIRSLC